MERAGAGRPLRHQEIHDRQAARRPQDLHGRPPRHGLPPPGRRNRKTLRVPRRLQTQVRSRPCRFREIERSNLDRHSYEVQIKELTQKLAEEESCRTENAKLKEFIKRQGVAHAPRRPKSKPSRRAPATRASSTKTTSPSTRSPWKRSTVCSGRTGTPASRARSTACSCRPTPPASKP